MTSISIGYDIKITSGIIANIDFVHNSPYTISTDSSINSFYLCVDSSNNPITIYLPTTYEDGMKLGRIFNITDFRGKCKINNIIIDAGSGNEINGSSTFVLNKNYTSIELLCTNEAPVLWSIV